MLRPSPLSIAALARSAGKCCCSTAKNEAFGMALPSAVPGVLSTRAPRLQRLAGGRQGGGGAVDDQLDVRGDERHAGASLHPLALLLAGEVVAGADGDPRLLRHREDAVDHALQLRMIVLAQQAQRAR